MAEFEPAVLSPFGQVRLQFGDRKLQVRATDLTIQTLAKIFHLLPETIILVSEQGTAAVPDDNGRFEVDDFLLWKVEEIHLQLVSRVLDSWPPRRVILVLQMQLLPVAVRARSGSPKHSLLEPNVR